MTLLVISPDYASHARPLLTIADAWRAHGERVVVATGPAVAPLVAGTGFELVRLELGRGSNAGVARPEDQPPGEDDHLRAFFEATRRGSIEALRFQAARRATDLLWEPVATARRTIEIVEELRPDAILVDHVAFGATVGLRAAGIPYADVVLGHPTQLPVAGETFGVPSAWPAVFAPDPTAEAGLRDLAGRVVAQFTAAYNDALQTIAPSAHAVPDAFAAHGSVVLLNYPEALHDRSRTAALPARHAFLGSALRVEDAGREASAWLDRDADRPLVVVSFGTFLSARGDVLARVAEALRGLDVRVAMAIGATAPNILGPILGPIPGDWFVRPHLPQVAMLERAAAFVTHGGNNSVTEAAALGVPMVALPFSTDQFDGAAAIETAGLGFAADPNRVDPDTLQALVGRLIAEPPTAVARLAEELGSRPGPVAARAAVAA
jgi:zeaxanthin glucosyltransferase